MQRLMQRIQDRKAVVGIIGMGYVGLPLAQTFRAAGFPVVGFDIDQAKVKALMAGRSYIKHITAASVGPDAPRATASRPRRDFNCLQARRRHHHLRADAADQGTRARHELHRRHQRGHPAAPEGRPTGGPRKHHLPRHHARGHDPDPRAERPRGRQGLLRGLQPRARGPRQPELHHAPDSQGRRRPGRGQPGPGHAPCTARPSTAWCRSPVARWPRPRRSPRTSTGASTSPW